jgi:threonine synthase
VAERPPFSADAIDPSQNTLWRYRAMIPLLSDVELISLGEGFTPLVPVELGGPRALMKLEFLAPTGSFKDRGTAVLVSHLKALGVREAHDDSSGNAAASLAAYCAYADIRCTLYVPAYASRAKLGQIAVYGAELITVEGPRESAAHAAQEAARESYYASHAHHPLILEGLKTLAYELWEQLNGAAPDALISPTGHGTFLLGTYRGYQDLRKAGVIDRLPRFIAVQSEACAPLYEAFRKGLSDVEDGAGTGGETIAEGIRIVRPPRAPEILRAIRETGGTVLIVSDEEIREAQSALAHHGLFVEPTSAAAVAGWRKLQAQRELSPDEVVVIPLTGSGLKTLHSTNPDL